MCRIVFIRGRSPRRSDDNYYYCVRFFVIVLVRTFVCDTTFVMYKKFNEKIYFMNEWARMSVEDKAVYYRAPWVNGGNKRGRGGGVRGRRTPASRAAPSALVIYCKDLRLYYSYIITSIKLFKLIIKIVIFCKIVFHRCDELRTIVQWVMRGIVY